MGKNRKCLQVTYAEEKFFGRVSESSMTPQKAGSEQRQESRVAGRQRTRPATVPWGSLARLMPWTPSLLGTQHCCHRQQRVSVFYLRFSIASPGCDSWWENLSANSKSVVHISAASGHEEMVSGLLYFYCSNQVLFPTENYPERLILEIEREFGCKVSIKTFPLNHK